MTKTTIVAASFLCLLVAGCENMNNQQQRALSGGAIGAAGGAAIGAAGGAAIGALTGGSLVTGALIGGAGGAAVGALTSSPSSSKNKH